MKNGCRGHWGKRWPAYAMNKPEGQCHSLLIYSQLWQGRFPAHCKGSLLLGIAKECFVSRKLAAE